MGETATHWVTVCFIRDGSVAEVETEFCETADNAFRAVGRLAKEFPDHSIIVTPGHIEPPFKA